MKYFHQQNEMKVERFFFFLRLSNVHAYYTGVEEQTVELDTFL